MKQGTKKILAIIVASVCLAGTIPTYHAEAAKSLTQLQNERKQLEQKTKEAKNELEKLKNKTATVEEEISAMDKAISAANAEADRAQADLDEVSARLEESKVVLAQATKDRDNQQEMFSKRVRFIYEQGNTGYLDIILESKSFSDLLVRMQYVEDIMHYDQTLLDKLKSNQKLVEKKTQDIQEEQKEAEVLVAQTQEKKKELDSILAEKQSILEGYKTDENKYNQLIASNEKASKEVENLIKSAEAAASAAVRNNGSSGSTYVYTGGKLNWPVPSRAASPSSLSSGFVYRARPIGSGYEYHTGYDIPASYGSAIVAAESGTVIYSGWMNGYGNTIMINHGNGLVTLYGHNSSLVVSKGQKVSRGQQVAKCGSTGNSTGNHCHFEVRFNGKPVSPESYLGVRNISS
ncbi:MAG: peptidoglycan DD-metalloendopeptidase family protein [Clostridiales bacterium]|nr:peptidoglycan DD-metalloendopeptidase family protein [Clostridiales bacterium]